MAVAEWSERALEMLKTGGAEGKLRAASSLRHLAATGPEQGKRMVEGGAIQLLLDLLRSTVPGTEGGGAENEKSEKLARAQVEAAGALRALTFNNGAHQEELINAGAVQLLVDMLWSPNIDLPEQVAGIVMNLAESSELTRRNLVKLGAIPILVKVIRCKVIMVSFSVHNVKNEKLTSSPEALATFQGIVQRVVADVVGDGVKPKDITTFTQPFVDRHRQTQRPAITCKCTVRVNGRADREGLQSRLRHSEELVPMLSGAFEGSKLEANHLLPIEVDGLGTPAAVTFSMEVHGVNWNALAQDMCLREAFEERVASGIQAATGGTGQRFGIKVAVPKDTDLVTCDIRPPAGVDAAPVLLSLQRTHDFLGHMTKYLQVAETGDVLAPVVAPEGLAISDLSDFRLSESVYEIAGTRGAQRNAAGALKNIVLGEYRHQEELVLENGVPALVALLLPFVPLGDLFNVIDRNQSGGISPPEFELGLVTLGYSGDSRSLWQVLDTDGDGELTWDEFVDRLTDEFLRRSDGRMDEKCEMAKFLAFLDTRFDSSAVQQEAAGALRNILLDNTDFANDVVSEGAVPPLIELMRSPAPEVREAANNALRVIAPPWAVTTVAGLRAEAPLDREHAARSLKKLASLSAEHRRTTVTAGAVPPLVALLRGDCLKCREQACGALSAIVYKNVDHEKLAVQAGAITALVPLLGDAKNPTSVEVRAEAVKTLGMLVASSPLTQRRIVEAGGIEAFVAVLKVGTPPEQRRAVEALLKLSSAAEYKKLLAKADIVKVTLDFINLTDDDQAQKLAEELHERFVEKEAA